MPEADKNDSARKRPISVPKPAEEASDGVLRDESEIYGDDADIPVRRRKRTDARVPIMRDRKKAAADSEASGDAPFPKVAPKRKKKKRPRRKRRAYKGLFDLMSATGQDSLFRPIVVFGKKIRLWPLFVLIAIVLMVSGIILNNSNLAIVEQSITIVGLPDELEGYRIVVLSDMNGRSFGDSQSLLLRTLNNLKYDAIFCLGDMVGRSGNAGPFWAFLEGLKDPGKVYFICGDSDPGPYLSGARATQGLLSELILEDWILGAIERGANYVDAPVCISVKDVNLWVSPATMLNYEASSTLEIWQEQTEQEVDGVRSGITDDYTKLPITTYRTRLAQQLYDAQRSMSTADLHISLAHEPPSDAFIYTSEDHNSESGRFLASPELIIAGHFCGGVWRLPGIGAFYVPDRTMARGGWFPEQEDVAGLSTVGETQVYITKGMSTNGSVPLMPFRLFNSPEISVLTLTSTLPENMLGTG